MKEITLSQGKIALVDDADYQLVSQFKWHAEKRKCDIWYAKRNLYKPDGMRTTQYLHQFLIPGAQDIDHRDGNGLNNQRENIRPCTHAQNMCNAKRQSAGSSRFKGVSYRYRKWQAGIRFQSKSYHLGSFLIEEDAARAYDAAAKQFHGSFARLNFPA